MNPWLKKVIFVAPPAVIAAVYLNLIPVGPTFRTKIDTLIGKEKNQTAQVVSPLVEKVRGEVFMKETPRDAAVQLKGDEILKEGASFATGENSSALLSHNGSYSWKFLVTSDTQVNIDVLMKMRDVQTSIINVIKGGAIISVNNNSDAPRNFIVRTKFASFAVKDATFSILTDGEKRTLVTVHKGLVEADNFKLMEKTPVREGSTYIVNRDGEQKAELDLDALDLYDWDLSHIDQKLPAIDEVTGKTGDVSPVIDDSEKKKLAQLKEIDQVITDFQARNEDLNRELRILSENAEQSREGFRNETKNVNKDIRCLETSNSECNLFNAKILYEKGFPRMWGNPRYRTSLVAGLQKYLQEREEEVSIREEEARILAKLMTLRESALKAVQVDRSREANLDKLIPLLQDDRLRR